MIQSIKDAYLLVYKKFSEKQNLLGVFIICFGLIITGVNGFLYYSMRTNNFSKNIPSDDPQVAPQVIDERTVTIATTTKTGHAISVTFLPCGLGADVTDKIGVCFGSGRSSPFTEEGITVWNLISEEKKVSFGVVDTNNEYQPYRIVVDFGSHTPTSVEFEYIRKAIPMLFIDYIIYEDPCWGIFENCRE